MQENLKVFHSEITRSDNPRQNDLYNLVKIKPAVSIKVNNQGNEKYPFCYFEPKIDKHFVPKKKSKLKVKTVRDIRNLFEKDVLSYLPQELEKQQSFLLRKITAGSSRNEDTKTLAKKMFNSDRPLSRAAWQMLMNLNPEGHTHNVQYVLWCGKNIRINGSKGGKTKFLCNFDLRKRKVNTRKDSKKSVNVDSKKGLLRNSITVKFKPGPLTKKVNLDDSYQKYNVGNVELIKLPKPALEIKPGIGITMEPRISNFLHNLRDVDGYVSKTWAEMATAVLGAVSNQSLIQNEESCVTFELKYKCDQNRLLVRRDLATQGNKCDSNVDQYHITDLSTEPTDVPLEIQTVVENILDAVEISLQQDYLYTGVDESREQMPRDNLKNVVNNAPVREKVVKRKYGELGRLDVTVIRLPDAPLEKDVSKCFNNFCTLGCVCSSIQCVYNLKDHCGRAECMFKCQCDFSKFNITHSLENSSSELVSGLFNLNNKMNLRLAREEQKFHQTVVVTGEKSILLKTKSRNGKASKRCGEFNRNMSSKFGSQLQPLLSIVTMKINCENIEPWCMVHNLYKCFCKGKFTEDFRSCENLDETELNETTADDAKQSTDVSAEDCSEKKNLKRMKIKDLRNDKNVRTFSISDSSDVTELEFISNFDKNKCARTTSYKGRKYLNSYYFAINKKIAELENNDDTLRQRMLYLIDPEKSDDGNKIQDLGKEKEPLAKKEVKEKRNRDKEVKDDRQWPTPGIKLTEVTENDEKEYYIEKFNTLINNVEKDFKIYSAPTQIASDSHTLSTGISKPGKIKMSAWIAQCYKEYKERLAKGQDTTTLGSPKHGRIALHPWAFILSRYRERKNVFFISNQGPYRIFMGRKIYESEDKFFRNCINIDDIRFADLHKYPITIKNLLTGTADDLKYDFCIMCGLTHCWELIGSVSKTPPKKNTNFISESSVCNEYYIDDSENYSDLTLATVDEDLKEKDISNNSENSKWFVMTVENDFTEIQFYKRGFFVKYESILRAINVAIMSGKTVRLSAQRHSENGDSARFGIYAIPNTNERCVFVGPYDTNENLGIDTVRNFIDVRKTINPTRGVWITTKSSDNFKVIDNPLAFMPSKSCSKDIVIVSLPQDDKEQSSVENSSSTTSKSNAPVSEKSSTSKALKRITIRKTDGFYHLASKDFLKKINSPHFSQPNDPFNNLVTKSGTAALTQLNRSLSSNITGNLHYLLKKSTITSRNVCPADPPQLIENKRPIAETPSRIQNFEVYSDTSATITSLKKECGMFILKPEEINKRLMMNKINCTSPVLPEQTVQSLDQDIENFLSTSADHLSPNAEIFEISDDDEDSSGSSNWRDVWIECKNIDNLGLIKGRLNSENKLSFEFPGFKFSDFYFEDEAFIIINQ